MSSFWHKVSSDLLIHKTRTLLAITSLAIGIFAIGTLLGMIDLQLSKMDASHRYSRPSHINLFLRNDATLAIAEQIKKIPGVANVDTITQFTIRFKTAHHQQWQIGTAILRHDYHRQQYDVMTLSSGQWPQAHSLGVEQLSAKYAGLSLGDKVKIETTKGSTDFVLNGIIRHPFVKPPPFGGQLHFFMAPNTAAQWGIPANTCRQLLVQVTRPYSEVKARMIAGEIRRKLQSLGIGVNATLLQNPEQHWGRPFFAGINLILTLMAWASLGLSSVLILNTIEALISQQTNQIGIMKSLGARRWTIARIYLTEVLLLSLFALCLALPLSLLAAYFSSQWLLNLFNINVLGFAYSVPAICSMIVGGLLAPLLAAIYPIWQGASLTVRDAIATYGLGGDFSTKRFYRWLERKILVYLPTLYAVTLGNIFRRKARMLWTQSVLIIAGILFIVIVSLIRSVDLTLDHELARSRFNIRLGFNSDQPSALVEALSRSVDQTIAVELWKRLPMEAYRQNKLINPSGNLGLQMLALPVNSAMYRPLIVAGRWFDHNDKAQQVLVINAETAEKNNIKVGDRLNVRLFGQANQSWQIIGMYRWFVGTGYAVEPVYAPLSTVLTNSQQGQTCSLALLTANVSTVKAEKKYADLIKQRFHDNQIKLDVYATILNLEQRQFAKNQFRPITSMLLGLASLIAIVATIGLSGMLAINVLQRTREIGVLRAIGASSPVIFKMFMLEGFVHGVIAWLITVPLAHIVAEPLAKKLGTIMLGIQLDFNFSWTGVLIWLGMVSVLVIAASYFPARRATKIAVRESLNY